jgi:hypothetical protein
MPAQGPEVRKKAAHGETVGITVKWDESRLAASKQGEDREGRQNINRETRQIRENFRFNRKSVAGSA